MLSAGCLDGKLETKRTHLLLHGASRFILASASLLYLNSSSWAGTFTKSLMPKLFSWMFLPEVMIDCDLVTYGHASWRWTHSRFICNVYVFLSTGTPQSQRTKRDCSIRDSTTLYLVDFVSHRSRTSRSEGARRLGSAATSLLSLFSRMLFSRGSVASWSCRANILNCVLRRILVNAAKAFSRSMYLNDSVSIF
jgi:hypothetical protein